ncbi:hypothetical protein FRC12_014514 [Ceratobasidium sp. 428]|nr:hypothetical protein FRC12_014514 [Ceratobasidium sp. 428]
MEQASHTRIPLEVILEILEYLLICETWEARALQLNRVLLLSHTVHKGIVKSAYSTIVLCSIDSASLFYDTLKDSPQLSSYVESIWIATSQLQLFDSSDYPFKWIEEKIERILALTGNMRRVAIPYAYFPRGGFPGVTHLTTTNNLSPILTASISDLETLNIHGLPSHHCINTIITRFGSVRRLLISIPPDLDEDEGALSFICARMVMSFRGRLARMSGLELIVNKGVAKILKEGMKKTLEDDSRISIHGKERRSEKEILYDLWLRSGWQ